MVDHYTYVLAGDGCMMEGISSEAASLAGHQQLGKLIVLYDDNHITIDGPTELAFTEDVCKRFEAYGWHVQRVADGDDVEAIDAAIAAAKAETGKPSLVAVRTHIGCGSPNKQDKAAAHGAPLGADEVKLTKEACEWPLDPQFYVADDVKALLRRGGQARRRRARGVERALRGVARRRRVPRPELGRRLGAQAARGLGRRSADVLAGRQARRDPRRLRQGHQRRGAASADAHRRLGRPGAVQQHVDRGRARPAGCDA